MEPPTSPPNSRRVISSGASRKEIFLAVLGALLVIALVGYSVINLGSHSARTSITGQVVEKKFVPRPETQLTIGAGGVQRNDKSGQYYLSVRSSESEEIYQVLLSEDDYNRAKIGDDYQIPRASLVP